MGYRYWLELPLIVGLVFRFLSDLFAGALFGDLMQDGERWHDYDPKRNEYNGTTLQTKPVVWNPAFPDAAYVLYGVMALYFALIFQAGFLNTIAAPGPVFGAVGIPPVVMKGVAYANVFVLYYVAGSYFATYAKRRFA